MKEEYLSIDTITRLVELEKENIKLKDLCDKYEEEHNNEFQCWKKDRKELLDKRGRIDKAIEYIELKRGKNKSSYDCEILNILRGNDDKSNE